MHDCARVQYPETREAEMGSLPIPQQKDQIDVVTLDVNAAATGVNKTSRVTVAATDTSPSEDLWVGLKIANTQSVTSLHVSGQDWVVAGMAEDKAALDVLNRVFPLSQPTERWTAFRVPAAMKPRVLEFNTRLELDRQVVSYPDAQMVTIAVCYASKTPLTVTSGNFIVGHSLVQAPRKAAAPVR